MKTPLQCAEDMASFLKGKFADYGGSKEDVEARIAEIASSIAEAGDADAIAALEDKRTLLKEMQDEPVNVYAGFLPNVSEMAGDKLCSYIVIRPFEVTDEAKESIASIVIYAAVYDESPLYGGNSLMHLLQRVRYELLSSNPVLNRWQIKDGMKMVVPEDQPYPIWLGQITFDVNVMRPENPKVMNEWERTGWRMERNKKNGLHLRGPAIQE